MAEKGQAQRPQTEQTKSITNSTLPQLKIKKSMPNPQNYSNRLLGQ
jgi:hypothetical protein